MGKYRHTLVEVDPNDPVRVRGKEIANQLGETNTYVRWQIYMLARHYGVPWVEKHANHALEIHANGGMPRGDGKGMRTLGGIFFRLVKKEIGIRAMLELIPAEVVWKAHANISNRWRRKRARAARELARQQQQAQQPQPQQQPEPHAEAS